MAHAEPLIEFWADITPSTGKALALLRIVVTPAGRVQQRWYRGEGWKPDDYLGWTGIGGDATWRRLDPDALDRVIAENGLDIIEMFSPV